MKLRLKLGLALMMVLSLLGCASSPTPQITPAVPLPTEETITVQEDGWYSTKEEVVEYLEAYGHLPENYITKKEAPALATVKDCFPALRAGLGMNVILTIKAATGERNALSFPTTV